MEIFFYFFFFYYISLANCQTIRQIYIDSSSNCLENCLGTKENGYNSLVKAIQNYNTSKIKEENIEFILLNKQNFIKKNDFFDSNYNLFSNYPKINISIFSNNLEQADIISEFSEFQFLIADHLTLKNIYFFINLTENSTQNSLFRTNSNNNNLIFESTNIEFIHNEKNIINFNQSLIFSNFQDFIIKIRNCKFLLKNWLIDFFSLETINLQIDVINSSFNDCINGSIFLFTNEKGIAKININNTIFTNTIQILKQSSNNIFNIFDTKIFNINFNLKLFEFGINNIITLNSLTFSNISSNGIFFGNENNKLYLLGCSFINIMNKFNNTSILFFGFFTNIEIKNSNFKNIDYEYNTAIIHLSNSSKILIDSCIFSNIYSKLAKGGIISLINGTNLIVTNSQFNGIRAGIWGGCFYIGYTEFYLSNSYFFNISAGMGSLMFIDFSCKITINDIITNQSISKYYNESSGYRGGVIHTYIFNNISIKNTQFLHSHNVVKAGIFYFSINNTFDIENILIYDVSVLDISGVSICQDNNIGIIINMSCINVQSPKYLGFHLDQNNSLLIRNAIFKNLTLYQYALDSYPDQFFFQTDDKGGATSLYLENTLVLVNATILDILCFGGSISDIGFFNNAYFKDIISKNHKNFKNDGAINIMFHNLVTVNNCFFDSIVSKEGSGISATDSENTLFLENLLFNNMSLDNSSLSSGACIFSYIGTTAFIINSTFQNSIGYFGAGIYISLYNTFYIIHSKFFNLSTFSSGAAIGAWLLNNFYLKYNIFENNYCENTGGGSMIAEVLSIIEIEDVIFYNCVTDQDGGALYFSRENHINIVNLKVYWCKAYRGGFLKLDDTNNLTITSAEISNTSSITQGGIFSFNLKNYIYLNNLAIFNVKVNERGGVFHLFSFNHLYDLNSTYNGGNSTSDLLTENYYYFGGFLYLVDENYVNLTDCTIYGIKNIVAGGAIYLERANILDLYNLVVYNITVSFSAGMMFIENYNNITIINLEIDNVNSKEFAGVFSMLANNLLNINLGNFKNINVFNEAGGIFFIYDFNKINIENSTFNNIYCKGNGGILYGFFGNIIMVNNTYFKNSYAELLGELIFLETKNNLTMNNTEFYNDKINLLPNYNFIFLNILNYIEIKNSRVQKYNCIVEGCLFSLYESNYLLLKESNFIINNENKSISFIFSNLGNFLEFKKNTFIFTNNQNTSKFIDFKTLNLWNSSENTYNFSFINQFLFSESSNYFMFYYDNIIKNSNITYCFVLNKNSTLKLKNFNVNFNIMKTMIIILLESFVIVDNCRIFNIISNISLFNTSNSTLKITKSEIYNIRNIDFCILTSILSIIVIDKSFFFNLKFSNSLLILIYSDLILKSNNFYRGRTYKHGIIYAEPAIFKTNIVRNCFLFNKGFKNTSILTVKDEYVANILIRNNSFKSNKGYFGGLFYLISPKNIDLIENTINDTRVFDYLNINKKNSKGGVLYLHDLLNLTNINLFNNVFTNNKAQVAPILYVENYLNSFLFDKNVFVNNSATLYGNLYSSSINKISFILPQSQKEDILLSKIYLKNIISGKIYENCLFELVGLDQYDNKTFMNDENIMNKIKTFQILPVSLEQTTDFSLKSLIPQENGNICFKGPITRNNIPLTMKFMYGLIYDNHQSINFTVEFKDCELGQILTEEFECLECEPGTYSLLTEFIENSICKVCDSSEFICEGGEYIRPVNSYWRSDKLSNNFRKCPNVDACYSLSKKDYLNLYGNIDEQYFTGICAEGYSGPLCNVCINGYGKFGGYTCNKCTESNWYYFLFVFAKILFKFWYNFLCIFVAFKTLLGITSDNFSKKRLIGINLLKILAIHYQILGYIPQIPLEWPKDFRISIPALLSFSIDFNEVFNFDCLMENSNLYSTYLNLILCPFFILILYIFTMIYVYIHQSSTKNSVFKKMGKIELAFCFLFIIIDLTYVETMKLYLEMFECINIGKEGDKSMNYLYEDMRINCNDSSHIKWIYGFVIPVVIFLLLIAIILIGLITHLYKNKKLDLQKNRFFFGYFYIYFKKDYMIWNFIVLVRRLLIFLLIVFLYENILSKSVFPLLLVNLILFLALFLQIYCQPYEENLSELNIVETGSLLTLSSTYFGITIYSTFFFKKWNFSTELFSLIVSIIVIFNVIYLGFWIAYYYKFNFKKRFSKITYRKSVLIDYEIQRNLLEINEYLIDENYKTAFNKEKHTEFIDSIYDDFLNEINPFLNNFEEKKKYANLSTYLVDEDILKIDRNDFSDLFKNNWVKIIPQKNEFLYDVEFSFELKNNCYEKSFLNLKIIFGFSKNFEIDDSGLIEEINEKNDKKTMEYEINQNSLIESTKFQMIYNINLKYLNFNKNKFYFYLVSKQIHKRLFLRIPFCIFMIMKCIPITKIKDKLLSIKNNLTSVASKTFFFKKKIENIDDIDNILKETQIFQGKKSKYLYKIGLISILIHHSLFYLVQIKFSKNDRKLIIELLALEEIDDEVIIKSIAREIINNLQLILVSKNYVIEKREEKKI